ncbi:helix-turn-helix transcriptional regulator [Streptomyces sp. JJ38]|uniref:helix-turn-helix domain-containing protein n=1 Tax=Streptomyces sp. JJ38 TaxID=2738128 RepID=UPI001C5A2D40|nr:helix-turn-helix transcriptional regulator [Streptomyces sp. JJ38]MBW1598037.1 helix-turn-helix transcriptional regulator [Streptomyces sp. JJ38]
MSNNYGAWLKARREAAGLTQQQLADLAIMTRSHIAHIEAGRRFPSEEDARRLDQVLNTGDVLTSFRPQEDIAVADYIETARQLEQQATVIREFAISYVPGILQTKEYATTVLHSTFPPKSEEECDRLVVTRLERAKILDDPITPVVWVLLDEAVLRRIVGGPDNMAAQIDHITRLAQVDRIRVHVLPFGLGAHALLSGMMTLMWFEDQPPAAYCEGMFAGKLHDSPNLVQRLHGMYDLALGDALPARESLALMKAIAEDYRRP